MPTSNDGSAFAPAFRDHRSPSPTRALEIAVPALSGQFRAAEPAAEAEAYEDPRAAVSPAGSPSLPTTVTTA